MFWVLEEYDLSREFSFFFVSTTTIYAFSTSFFSYLELFNFISCKVFKLFSVRNCSKLTLIMQLSINVAEEFFFLSCLKFNFSYFHECAEKNSAGCHSKSLFEISIFIARKNLNSFSQIIYFLNKFWIFYLVKLPFKLIVTQFFFRFGLLNFF